MLGIAIGDAFGESFFGDENTVLAAIDHREIPATSWEFTDDTVMALAVYEELEADGHVDQDRLAGKFARNYALDNRRGYGGTAHKILREIHEGQDWNIVAARVFDGMGSMGNGSAMRVGPIGGYFSSSDDFEQMVATARASATVTHSHQEAIAGAIAVAAATAFACSTNPFEADYSPEDFIRRVAAATPESDTKYRIAKAASFPKETHLETLKVVLGNGSKITAPDTVPFTIWSAAHGMQSFEEALWKSVSVLGDRDTICAIVGGIVIMACDPKSIPLSWVESVEDFAHSIFRTKGSSSMGNSLETFAL